MNILDFIRNFDSDSSDLEGLVAISAVGRSIQSEFKSLEVDEPVWLGNNLEAIRSAIAVRKTDRLRKELAEMESRFEAMKPAEQKRQELAEKIAAARAKLG